MGCWNGTCGVSQLPIYAGDPVVAFPLLQEPRADSLGGGFCYVYDRAQPLTIGIRGTYNDYGGIEDLKGKTLPAVTRFFSENAEKYVDENGEPSELDFTDLEAVLNEGIERGDLYNSDLNYGTNEPYLRQLGLMLVHESLYDKLVAQASAMHSWRDKSKTLREIFVSKLAPMVAPVQKTQNLELLRAMQGLEMVQSLGSLTSLVARQQRFNAHFLEETRKASKAVREATLNAIVDLILFNEALTVLRTPWAIQAGAGSQAGYSTFHQTLVQDMSERVEAHAAELAEDA